ncbi:hypothetical protein [Haloarchaeobius sp. HRN-SO-5]|uniref:hypothetical protein n=1 Tax=Haloarchaeobius sp. HRN-SO-5 TaxID=3446118 RepID=UPI003EBD3DA6
MSNSSLQESTTSRDLTDVEEFDAEELDGSVTDAETVVDTFEYREWLLLAPAVIALAYLPLVLAFGQELLYTTRNGEPNLVGFALMAVLVAVSAFATGHLYDDAAYVSETTDWTPNPLLYTAAGTAVVTAALVGRVVALGITLERPVEFVGGTIIVAVLLSSVVECPAYVYQRRRHVDE